MTTIELASFLAAAGLALTRMAPFLDGLWGKIPAKYRWLPPVVIAALPQIAAQLGMVQTKTDWATFALFVGGLVVPGARSSAHKAATQELAAAKEVLSQKVEKE